MKQKGKEENKEGRKEKRIREVFKYEGGRERKKKFNVCRGKMRRKKQWKFGMRNETDGRKRK